MQPVAPDDGEPTRAPHFYDASDIAALLDTPCKRCARTGIAPDGKCETGSSACDRWTTRRARDWLKATKAGIRRGGRWITTRERLREHFPELWDLIVVRAVGDEDE